MSRYSNQLMYMTPFEQHKRLINVYVLQRKGSSELLKRNTSRDKRDIDVIRENHCFLWEDDVEPNSWEKRLAKKYYDKLFKEYCICDLSLYKENKVAMRWQTEPELISGKGQFVCGEKKCANKETLRSWEVNFGYIEHGEKKNALVKLRLCPDCSEKLNYKTKRKEVKKKKLKRLKSNKDRKREKVSSTDAQSETEVDQQQTEDTNCEENEDAEAVSIWKQKPPDLEEPSRDEEFEEYLEELLL
ncbi:protein FRA10AC1-like isoform X1 [Nilaparvata lugens]|uniref:protein FRA10AC1-like isoform X1 n=1 Tax=Nilaparvata lugens TaxID=108931 RepID=UPI00193DCC47|nr:protein FRA10AC1-like isoform X1 [Nilaparvata lugens]